MTTSVKDRTAASTATCAQPREELALLLAMSARGDTDAFLAFYDRTCGTAHHLALAVCGDPDRAGDLLQSLYTSAWTRAAQHAGSGLSPLAWLLADVVRRARLDAEGRRAGG